MLWTRESTCVCLYSFSALADPVHVSVYLTEDVMVSLHACNVPRCVWMTVRSSLVLLDPLQMYICYVETSNEARWARKTSDGLLCGPCGSRSLAAHTLPASRDRPSHCHSATATQPLPLSSRIALILCQPMLLHGAGESVLSGRHVLAYPLSSALGRASLHCPRARHASCSQSTAACSIDSVKLAG